MSEAFDTATMARLVAEMPPAQLAEGLRANREPILSEVFRRFCERLSEEGRQTDAVIQWRISGGSGPGGYDRWFVVLRDGACETGRDLDLRPRVTFTADPLDFLRLVTGKANPLRMVLTRRLRVRGDLALAARMPRLFRVPAG